jgi:hypothetical protein
MSVLTALRFFKAQIASCDCGAKSPFREAHEDDCRYAVIVDAETEITRLRSELSAAKEAEAAAHLGMAAVRKALEFYADPANHMPSVFEAEQGVRVGPNMTPIQYESGKRATQALATLPDPSDCLSNVRELVEAARDLLRAKSDTFGKGKRQRGIEADDGEKCWIVHSDNMALLEGALSEVEAFIGTPQQSKGG